MEGWCEEKDGALIVRVHVQPRASKNEVAGVHDGSLKVRLTSPPFEGAANTHLIKFIAKILGVPKSQINIVSGEKSRQKRLKIDSLTRDQFLSRGVCIHSLVEE
ncbi:MAG: YggU family protein [Proteobacteria bacterium]|nr:YggU family protein [Pseudomonadota bacterium]